MKTIILDGSGIFHATIRGGTFNRSEFKKTPNGITLDLADMRAGLLGNMLMFANSRVGRERFTDNVVIALDKPPYWRKNIFPGYKCSRSATRDKDEYDWRDLLAKYDALVTEFEAAVPWKFMYVDSLEADDVIGILTPRLAGTNGRVHIISSDKDLVQLQRYKGVSQFSPITKKAIKPEVTAFHDLMVKILKGDTGDSIPNIYTADDFFLRKGANEDVGKQKPVTAKLINEIKDSGYDVREHLDEQAMAGFKRNLSLVDLSRVPNELVDACINRYNTYSVPGMSKLQAYLVTNRLSVLADRIKEFYGE